jgi:seryl-tRNA synthetase
MFDKYVKWVEAHERHLLVLAAGFVLWFGIGRIDTLIANHDAAGLQQAKVVAQVQQDKNDALAKQIAQDKADYTALAAQVQARDAQLVQLQATLVTALAQRQATDKTSTPTELTQRWNVLVPEAGAAVTPNGVTLPSEGARATVIELEKAPVLQQQLAASGEELANANKLVAAEGQQVTSLTALVGGLQVKAVDDAKVCDARVKVETDKVRKARRRWFVIGYVAGFLSRQYIKTTTGF